MNDQEAQLYSRLLTKASEYLSRQSLAPLDAICRQQDHVTTRQLRKTLDNIAEWQRLDGLFLRGVAEWIRATSEEADNDFSQQQ